MKTQLVKKKNKKDLILEKKAALEEANTSDSDNESLDSDQELQLAFARKELTPGLNVQTAAKKVFVNDEAGMERKLKDLYLKMDWVERLDITTPKFELPEPDANGNTPSIVDNDFQRESLFLKQAQDAVEKALPRLAGFGILTKRAEDYFAEMSKSDGHMKKVRATLLTKHAEIEKRDKIRKLRELKKMGKKIQVETEQKRAQEKKKVYKSEKQFVDDQDGKVNRKPKQDDKKSVKRGDKKKTFKEAKYGFGGRKKRSKYNTAESSADAFKTNRSGKGGKGGKGGKVSKGFKKPANKNKPKQKGRPMK